MRYHVSFNNEQYELMKFQSQHDMESYTLALKHYERKYTGVLQENKKRHREDTERDDVLGVLYDETEGNR